MAITAATGSEAALLAVEPFCYAKLRHEKGGAHIGAERPRELKTQN